MSEQKCEVTIDSLTRDLEETRRLALEKEQTGAAVDATMGIAKLHGLLIERRQIKGTLNLNIDNRNY